MRLRPSRRQLLAKLSRLRQSGPTLELAMTLRELGELERKLAARRQALEYYEEAVSLLRDQDEPSMLAHTLRHTGDLLQDLDRSEAARPCHAEALAIYRGLDDLQPLDLAKALRSMAILEEEQDQIEAAIMTWQEAHDLYAACEIIPGIAEAAAHLALLYGQEGDRPDSRDWLDRASMASEASADPAAVRYLRQVRERLEV